jgi:hypothetical protein
MPTRSLVRVSDTTLATVAPAASITKSSHEKPCLVKPSLTSFPSPVAIARPQPHRIAAFSE